MTETNDNGAPFSKREEIEMLLPWYVTGKLDPDERAAVEAHLARDAAMRQQLELIREERRETVAGNEAVAMPRAAALDDLMADVRREGPQPAAGGLFSSLKAVVGGFFAAPTAGAVRWAAAAACAVVFAQAVAIGTLITDRGAPPNYQTASGRQQMAAEGTFALVQFSGAATAASIATALNELDLQIVAGPKPGGIYRVRLADSTLRGAELEQRLGQLKARQDIFSLVTPSN